MAVKNLYTPLSTTDIEKRISTAYLWSSWFGSAEREVYRIYLTLDSEGNFPPESGEPVPFSWLIFDKSSGDRFFITSDNEDFLTNTGEYFSPVG